MTTPFDNLPRFDAAPEVTTEQWLSMTRDEREQYATEHGIGDKLVAFVTEHGPSQVWYPTTTDADYDVLQLVDGALTAVPGEVVAAVEAQEAARP